MYMFHEILEVWDFLMDREKDAVRTYVRAIKIEQPFCLLLLCICRRSRRYEEGNSKNCIVAGSFRYLFKMW